MFTALIVDDEQSCIDRLSGLLAGHCRDSIAIAGTAQNVREGLHEIKTKRPDLVFLDVQLGAETGFDLLRQVPNMGFAVIFTTAYEQYAVQAFKFSALDYLLKPVDPEDLLRAVGRLAEKVSRDETLRKLDALFHNLKDLHGLSKKIAIPTEQGLLFVDVADIIRCQSDENYTTIFLREQPRKITVAKTLKEFEELLSEYNFFRVHNSHLINLSHIKKYHKGKGGSVSMVDNSEVEVSTRRKEKFLKRIAAL